MNKMCLLYYLIYLCFFFSCSTIKLNKNNNKLIDEINNEFSDIQPIIIYKTTLDYSKNVPVILSSDKSKIISYPSPKDVFYKENFAYPTKLTDGFLMDNIGISCNSAYLNLTLEEYSKYDEIPSLENLYKFLELNLIFLYLNSDAISISTSILVSSSNQYFATKQE